MSSGAETVRPGRDVAEASQRPLSPDASLVVDALSGFDVARRWSRTTPRRPRPHQDRSAVTVFRAHPTWVSPRSPSHRILASRTRRPGSTGHATGCCVTTRWNRTRRWASGRVATSPTLRTGGRGAAGGLPRGRLRGHLAATSCLPSGNQKNDLLAGFAPGHGRSPAACGGHAAVAVSAKSSTRDRRVRSCADRPVDPDAPRDVVDVDIRSWQMRRPAAQVRAADDRGVSPPLAESADDAGAHGHGHDPGAVAGAELAADAHEVAFDGEHR